MQHSRHGHLGYQNIKKLAKMCVGIDLTIPPPSDAYEPYSIANIKVEPHKRHIEPGRQENDLIHSDIQGPFPTSYDSYRWIITFLDDKTLRSTVAFLPNKEGPTVLGAFKTFLNQVEHSECKCTRFRTDCGTEYDNYDIYAFRLTKGIIWEGIIPGNPQINGKSERLGQTIQQKASAILKESQLPQRFQTEFVRASNYLRNVQPISGRDVTPHEAYTGRPPDLSHLRIIRQTGYYQVHLGNTGWSKYQDRAHKGKLLSYKGRFYRMLIPNSKVEVFSNVQWINNVPPKPTPIELTPSGVQQANNENLSETRNKRRNNAIHDVDPKASTSSPGESITKRRREDSVEATTVAKQYVTTVRVPLATPKTQAVQKPTAPPAQPIRVQPPRGVRGDLPAPAPIPSPTTPLGEAPESPDTLSNNTLTPSTVSKDLEHSAAGKPTTRLITNNQPSGQQPPRHKILQNYRDLTPDPLSLLAKANAPEPYEPQSYKEAIADEYIKMHQELTIQEEVDSLVANRTQTLVDLPSNAHALGGKQVFKIKRGP